MKTDGASILVVDDELELLEIFSAWLGRSGFRVFTAPNGAEALKALQARQVDVLLSDIRMPIMDGVALVRNLNRMETPPPRIIFVTGYGNFSRREIFGLGVEALLDKPLSRPILLDALARCLIGPRGKMVDSLAAAGRAANCAGVGGHEGGHRRRRLRTGTRRLLRGLRSSPEGRIAGPSLRPFRPGGIESRCARHRGLG